MDWISFLTYLAQIAIGAVSFMILSIPVGFGISLLVYGVVRALPTKNDSHGTIFRGNNNDYS